MVTKDQATADGNGYLGYKHTRFVKLLKGNLRSNVTAERTGHTKVGGTKKNPKFSIPVKIGNDNTLRITNLNANEWDVL